MPVIDQSKTAGTEAIAALLVVCKARGFAVPLACAIWAAGMLHD